MRHWGARVGRGDLALKHGPMSWRSLHLDSVFAPAAIEVGEHAISRTDDVRVARGRNGPPTPTGRCVRTWVDGLGIPGGEVRSTPCVAHAAGKFARCFGKAEKSRVVNAHDRRNGVPCGQWAA